MKPGMRQFGRTGPSRWGGVLLTSGGAGSPGRLAVFASVAGGEGHGFVDCQQVFMGCLSLPNTLFQSCVFEQERLSCFLHIQVCVYDFPAFIL